jgi:CDP-glucose 4,6-dehydratase
MTSVWQRRSVFVTGAGGFVGSWLAHRLAEEGAQVTVILRDEPLFSNFQLLGLPQRVNVVRGSITNQQLVERILNEYAVDTCFHLAAQAIVGVANRSPISTFESNISGTWCVLEACRVTPTIERVVVASSDKAYGSQPVLPYTEDMSLLGVNPYDASKVCADVLARSYQRTYRMPLAVARCANIYGGGDLNFSRLIPGTIRSALLSERPVIRSDGTPVRDYLHVDDAVNAYLTLAERAGDEQVAANAFNFGTDSPINALDLVRLMLDIAHTPELQPDIRGSGAPAGEINRQYLNSDRARATLGWMPQVNLHDGLRRTVSWYRHLLAASDHGGGAALGRPA